MFDNRCIRYTFIFIKPSLLGFALCMMQRYCNIGYLTNILTKIIKNGGAK